MAGSNDVGYIGTFTEGRKYVGSRMTAADSAGAHGKGYQPASILFDKESPAHSMTIIIHFSIDAKQ